jgi:hypothetical protein
MTEKQFKAAVYTMVQNAVNSLTITQKIQRVISSGSTDVESIPKDDYSIVKAAAYAIVLDLAEDLRPLSSSTLKEANNISKFL